METFLIKVAVLVFSAWMIDTAEAKGICPNGLFKLDDYLGFKPYRTNEPCLHGGNCPNPYKQCCIATDKVSLCHNLVKSEGRDPSCPSQLFKSEEGEKFKPYETRQHCVHDTDCTEEQCCVEVNKPYTKYDAHRLCHYKAKLDKNDVPIPLPPTVSSCPDENPCNNNSVGCSDDNDCRNNPEISKLVDAEKYGCCHLSPGCCMKVRKVGHWNACNPCDKVIPKKNCKKACQPYAEGDNTAPAENPCGEDEVCCPTKRGCCIKKLHSNRRLSADDQKICIKVRTRPSKSYEEASFTATIKVKDGYIMNSQCTRSSSAYCSEALLD